MVDKLPILVLTRNYTDVLSYFDDWEDALTSHTPFSVSVRNVAAQDELHSISKDIEIAPFVLLLHSTNSDGCNILRQLMPAFQARKGRLVVFVGNEVNLPLAPMAEKLLFLSESKPDLILSQLTADASRWYYGPLVESKVLSLPHALNPKAYKPGLPLGSRPIQIGARTHQYGPYIGDTERVELHRLFQRVGKERGMATDIRIGGGRFNREGWSDFLGQCQCTISTEAGSAWLDRDDALMRLTHQRLLASDHSKIVLTQNSAIRQWLRFFLPPLVRKTLSRLLGDRLVEDYNLGTELDSNTIRTIQAEVFTDSRRAPFYTKAISSRHFDAIGTRTAQILLEGRYNEILMPGTHFIPIRRDFSNLEEVLDFSADISYCQRMVDETLDFALSAHTHAHRMLQLESELRSL